MKKEYNKKTRWQKEKFKGIAQVRKKFEAMDISMLLAFVDRETVIRQEVTDKQTLLDDLLKIHVSMEEKYNIARGKLENARQAFKNT